MSEPCVNSWASPGRIKFAGNLVTVRQGAKGRPLHEVVTEHLADLWETGTRAEHVLLRVPFIARPKTQYAPPPLAALIHSRGLQLRLILLAYFEAHCRYEAGQPYKPMRFVPCRRRENEPPGWADLVLTYSLGSAHMSVADLRARQIREAIAALHEKDLVAITKSGRSSRGKYDSWRPLSEASTPDDHIEYEVPTKGIRVDRRFFTNLWIFTLTDAEIAVYLTLCALRRAYPARHETDGVFLTSGERTVAASLTRKTWRSTDALRKLRLIQQQPIPGRDYATGKVDPGAAEGRLLPVRFKIVDETLASPAPELVLQRLSRPTQEDRRFRTEPPLDPQLGVKRPSGDFFAVGNVPT
jgi:hypothetical protein